MVENWRGDNRFNENNYLVCHYESLQLTGQVCLLSEMLENNHLVCDDILVVIGDRHQAVLKRQTQCVVPGSCSPGAESR